MTPQEIFNKAYEGVVAQGRPSTTSDGGCRYAGPEGTRCGVGHLVPLDVAEAWDARANDAGIGLILDENEAPGIEPWMHAHRNLLNAVQDAHDSAARHWRHKPDDFVPLFKTKMLTIANRYGLELPR